MKHKLFNLTILIGFITLLCLTISIPLYLFEKNERMLHTESFPMEKIETKLDSEYSDIYLVQFIHNHYDTSKQQNREQFSIEEAAISNTLPISISVLNGLGIISNEYIASYLGDTMATYFYKSNEPSNSFEEYAYNLDGQIDYFYTSSTQADKIFYVGISFSDAIEDLAFTNIDKKTIMENFINYLQLNCISDWVYNGISYTSQKAQLHVEYDINFDQNYAQLQILPLDYYIN